MKQLISVMNLVRRIIDKLYLLHEELGNHEQSTDMCRGYLGTYGVF